MSNEIEQALEAARQAAEQDLAQAEKTIEGQLAEAEQVLAEARATRRELIAEAKQTIAEPKERLKRVKRALRALRGEALAPSTKGRRLRADEPQPPEKVERVFAALKAVEAADEPPTVARIRIQTLNDGGEQGIGWDVVRKCLQQLRDQDRVRRAGVKQSGQKAEVFHSIQGAE